MAIYTVELDGEQFDVEGPDDASPQALESFVRANKGSLSSPTVPPVESKEQGLLDPSKRQERNRAMLRDQIGGAVSNVVQAPIQAGKALLTDPTKVAAETPILPVAGAIAAGPAGGAIGEGLRQMASISRGEPAPSPIESAAQMGLASLTPSVAKGASKAGNLVKALAKEPVEAAKARTGELLASKGLKDIRPIIFNKGERDAAVQYAETVAKNANNLTSVQLQEARATLKDILDNGVVKVSSPTGSIVAKSKDVVTKAFRKLNPDVSKAFDLTDEATQAAGIRSELAKASKQLPIVGPIIRALGTTGKVIKRL